MLPEQFLDSRWLLALETMLVALATLVAITWKGGKDDVPFGKVELALKRLSSRPWLQAAVVGALAVALRAILLPVLGKPVPYWPDEFSVLLQGQTFALGRFANPPHVLHEHLESVYVSQLPTYSSMYFPGRGAPLALGALVFGEPWAGVWLSMVALSVIMIWMLRGWVSDALALLGSILVVLKFGVLSGWMNEFHGGGLAALGGALILGAYPRLKRMPRWRDGAALGIGLFILMLTRPFEGLLLSVPLMIALLFDLLGRLRSRETVTVARIVAPTVIMVGAGLMILLTMNQATTGHPLLTPYSHNRATHAVAPAFLFQEVSVPSRSLPMHLETYYADESNLHSGGNFIASIFRLTFDKLKSFIQFYIGPAFLLPFLAGLAMVWRQPVLFACGSILFLGFMLLTWFWAHYLAPGLGLFMIVIMQGFARMRDWRYKERPTGLFLSRTLPLVAASSTIIPMAALLAGANKPEPKPLARPCCAVITQTARSMIISQLERSPGRDLVLVRHREGEASYMTLVANDAEVDKSEIVWAYDLGAKNDHILNYYPDRKVWLVEGVNATKAVPFTSVPKRDMADASAVAPVD